MSEESKELSSSLPSPNKENSDVSQTCVVCGRNSDEKELGAIACLRCEELFKHAAKFHYDPVCRITNCTDENIIFCDFCRLNKCFVKGMKMADVYSKINTHLADREIRKTHPVFRDKKQDGEWRWAKALQSMKKFKQSFYDWISSFPEYQKLSDEHKEILKKRCGQRGMLMELVENSYGIHQVLRFHKFFWDPFKYKENNVTRLMGNILSFTMTMEDHCKSKQQFNALKLKLILKNDVHMELEEEDERALPTLMEQLDDIEAQLIKNIENPDLCEETSSNEEPSLCESEGINAVLIPDDSFPRHRIKLVM